MGRITQNAIALKIARRSVKRNRLQSLLIIAIIALPMALAGFALTYVESSRPTGPELVKYQLGLALARFQVVAVPSDDLYQLPTDSSLSYREYVEHFENQEYVDLPSLLPDVSLLSISNGVAEFQTATGIGSLSVVIGDSWNSAFLGKGPVELTSGRLPSGANEVLVSTSALDRFGIRLGESITTTAGQEFTVTGTLAESSRGKLEDVVYFRENSLGVKAISPFDTLHFQLVGESPVWSEIQKLNKQGVAVVSRQVILNPPPASELPGGGLAASFGRLVAALFLAPIVLLPVVVLAGSAFAFGARRQTRTLAVLSSLGANKNLLRKVTLASGVWLGLIGGIAGLSLGVSAAFSFGPSLAELTQGGRTWLNYPGFHLPVTMLGLALLASVVLGAITSLVPAIKASNVNVLATLRGSRTEGQVRIRSGVGALVMLTTGIGAILTSLFILLQAGSTGSDFELRQMLSLVGVLLGLGGSIVTVVSFMVGTGWILKLIRSVMSRLGSTANFAGKDLLFNRKRYSPVIASVLTVTFVASFVASFFYGPTKAQFDFYQYRWLPGQAGIQYSVIPEGFDTSRAGIDTVSAEDFWAGVPRREVVESERKLVMATGGFHSATIVNSTIDVQNSMGTIESDGTVAKQFDLPIPVVIYNPDATCYYTGLSPKSSEWLAERSGGLSQADMKLPAGCIAVENPSNTIVVGDASVLRAIIKDTDSTAEATLSAGGVVLFNSVYDYDGKARISWLKPSDYSWAGRNLNAATKTVELKSHVVGKISSNSFGYSAMISPETAAKYDIKAFPTSMVVNYTGEVPTAATDQLNSKNIYIEFANGTGLMNPDSFAWVIILFASLFSLASTGIALGLSQIEARTDKRTLSAIGAPRSFRARLVSSQAFALTVTGSILGALTGLMLGAAMLIGIDPTVANYPWLQLAALVFGVPMVAALAFWIFTPRSLKYETRQALD